MLGAFEELGYEVFAITGYARERERLIGQLREDIAKGKRFDFAYSESHTLPLLLTEPNHLPWHPFVDRALFKHLNRKGVPLGLFYRDVHWRFDHFKAAYPALRRHFATFFYRQEWNLYRRVVDHLFLPSNGMAAALPTPWPADRLSALPPGIIISPSAPSSARAGNEILRLLYVGGVTPPLYDLTSLFEALGTVRQVRLTLCCRREEWQRVGGQYAVPSNVEIVHAAGGQLAALYEQADIAALLMKPNPYLDFAMPVKLFEAIGHGVPVVALAGSETARFVHRERVGWVVDSVDEFRSLVESLLRSPDELATARRQVSSVQERHTWQARAQHVARTLTALRP